MSLQLEPGRTPPHHWISSLTYQSKATVKPTRLEIDDLASKARARNRSYGITGMLLYEDGRFLQTLEGPPGGLKQLWTSICRDNRHSDIDVLSEHIVPSRLFAGWDLLLYNRDDRPNSQSDTGQEQRGLSDQVPTLIDLALNGDEIGLNTLMASLAEQGWAGEAIITDLIEAAARALGDAWLSDECTELDVTMGLSMLQLAGHAVRQNPTPESIRQGSYKILLATAPGEPHMLGTSMLADLFTESGWQVDMAFPENNEALVNQLNAQQPDAVDIGLSDALPRQHKLARLRETVDKSRFAAPEHLTVVSVGGRLFTEAAATANSVGADHARRTVPGTSIRIAELIRQKRQEPTLK